MRGSDDIDFWFTVGSTYTYLTASRLHEVETATGMHFRWRPFNARAIMHEMNNVPFATKPVKLAYMWRDLERRASKYGLPIKVPAPYPLQEYDFANRVAVVGQTEGWCPDYVRATYRRWFVDGSPPGSEPNLSESLAEIGQDPSRVISLARSDTIGHAYATATDEARLLKISGLRRLFRAANYFGATIDSMMRLSGMLAGLWRSPPRAAVERRLGERHEKNSSCRITAQRHDCSRTGPRAV